MTVLVTGAHGKVGRQVAELLTARGVPIRPGSRRAAVPLNWADPATWPAALDGVESVFLVVPGGDDGHRSVVGLGAGVCGFLDLARDAGVSRVVLMTALGMEYAPAEVEQRAVERHLQGCGVPWTVLRPNWFFQNLTEGPLRVLADAGDGVLRLPVADAAVSFIDTRDIAAVAVGALLDEDCGREYALTGPESLTLAAVAAACRPTGIPLTAYEPVTDSEFRATARALGWHPEYVDTLSTLFATIEQGLAAAVTPDTEKALGRRPRTLTDFIGDMSSA
ncbi:NAD(P)H-binding protein [Streptomyces sp. NPDC091377]|uniref:NAD(P)H-binding protein n=1 Tax=Streptomyces sp. NPDC091377 TaxID=3365995 RepID=UPI0038169DD4